MLREAQRLALTRRFASRRVARQNQLGELTAFLNGRAIDPTAIEPLARQQERARLLVRSEGFMAGLATADGRRVLEAVVGRDDRLPRSFLTGGVRTANAVCQIATLAGDGNISFGTGFAIAPGLVMTNNHVLPDALAASQGRAVFGVWSDRPDQNSSRISLRLDPQNVFLTDVRLDFTLVAIEPRVANALYEAFGAIEILPQSGKALVGEAVNVIQHGDGEAQTASLRDNVVVDVFDDWLHYTSDTSPGASGSPVLNDQWQLAALHHASFEHVGADGRRVTVNEGIRISSIAQRLAEMIR